MSSVCANSLIRLLAASRPDTFTGNTILIRLWRRFPMLVSMRVAMGPREDRLSLLVALQRPFSLKGGFCISGHEISQLQNRAQTQSRADDRFCHNTFSCFVIVRGVSWRSRV